MCIVLLAEGSFWSCSLLLYLWLNLFYYCIYSFGVLLCSVNILNVNFLYNYSSKKICMVTYDKIMTRKKYEKAFLDSMTCCTLTHGDFFSKFFCEAIEELYSLYHSWSCEIFKEYLLSCSDQLSIYIPSAVWKQCCISVEIYKIGWPWHLWSVVIHLGEV